MDPVTAAADVAPQALTVVSLWLPVVLSTVAVFFLSFAMWMVLPHHKADWRPIPKEDDAMNALRDAGVGSGQYTFPHCASKELWKDPDFIKKFEAKASMQKRTGGLMGLGLGNASDMGSNLEAGLEDILDSGNFHNDDPMFNQFD